MYTCGKTGFVLLLVHVPHVMTHCCELREQVKRYGQHVRAFWATGFALHGLLQPVDMSSLLIRCM